MKDQKRIIDILHNSIFTELILIEDSISPIDIRVFCSRLISFMHSSGYQANISLSPILFAVFSKKNGVGKCKILDNNSEDLLKEYSSKSTNIVCIDYFGKEINYNDFKNHEVKNTKDVSILSDKNHNIKFFFLDNNNLTVFYKGLIKEEIPDVFSLSEYRNFSNKIPIYEYDKILSKYMNYFDKRV